MRKKNWVFSKIAAIALVVLVIASFVLITTPAFATDAMKPGHGNGDDNHVHYGAPGH